MQWTILTEISCVLRRNLGLRATLAVRSWPYLVCHGWVEGHSLTWPPPGVQLVRRTTLSPIFSHSLFKLFSQVFHKIFMWEIPEISVFLCCKKRNGESASLQPLLSIVKEIFYLATETIISVSKNRKKSINNLQSEQIIEENCQPHS